MNIDSKRFLEAAKLLDADFTSIEKFESVRNLVKGFNPTIDNILEKCSGALEKIDNLKSGEVLNLSAEGLPAETEEEKRRKKAIILFLKYYKELKSEVERVKGEFQNQQGSAQTSKNILSHAKGPFGILTAIAILIVAATVLVKSHKVKRPSASPTPTTASQTATPVVTPSPITSPSPKPKIKVITFQAKKIPLTELRTGSGPECDSPHYHPQNHVSVRALDGSTISDPNPSGCGFGKVQDFPIEEVTQP